MDAVAGCRPASRAGSTPVDVLAHQSNRSGSCLFGCKGASLAGASSFAGLRLCHPILSMLIGFVGRRGRDLFGAVDALLALNLGDVMFQRVLNLGT